MVHYGTEDFRQVDSTPAVTGVDGIYTSDDKLQCSLGSGLREPELDCLLDRGLSL